MASQLLELPGGWHLSALDLQKQEGEVTGENWHFHCLQDEKHGSPGTTLDALVMEVHLDFLILKLDFSVDLSEENAPDHPQICQVRQKEVKIPSDQETRETALTIHWYLGWILQQMRSLHCSIFGDFAQGSKTHCLVRF